MAFGFFCILQRQTTYKVYIGHCKKHLNYDEGES